MNKGLASLILTLLNLKGIGPSFIGKYKHIIQDEFAKGGNIDSLLSSLNKTFDDDVIENATQNAATIVELCIREKIKVTTIFDDNYPEVLESYKSKFPIIYSQGDYLNLKTIGIIGSRNATEVSSKIAERIGSFCVQNNLNILNGVADGIDMMSANSKSALKSTIGIIPGGLAFEEFQTLSNPYLKNARNVLKEGGCLISQFSPNIKQDQFKVVEYCKLQAALSDSLVLVQSKLDGGSKFTVEHFCQAERTLFVVNGSHYDSNSEVYSANNLLIEKKQAGIAEWCEIKPQKIKCKIEVINSKEDYKKLLDINLTAFQDQTLF